VVSEPTAGGGAAAVGFVPGDAGAGGTVREGSTGPGAGGSGAVGSAAAGLAPPCERRAAERVISRDPHPGQVVTPSGSGSGAIGVWQRGHFMAMTRVMKRTRGASIT
jgi:hypothetical protein